MYDDVDCSLVYAGCLEHAEEFLQTDGEYGYFAMGGIAEWDAGAAGDGDGGWGELVEQGLLLVRECVLQDVGEVYFFEIVCLA